MSPAEVAFNPHIHGGWKLRCSCSPEWKLASQVEVNQANGRTLTLQLLTLEAIWSYVFPVTDTFDESKHQQAL